MCLFLYQSDGMYREKECFLVRCPVLPLFFVFEHIQIRGIARLADVVLFYCFAHSAARFVAVCAVVVLAVGRCFKYFFEVVTHLFFLHIERAEAFDARCVDDVAVALDREHLRESSGMHSFIMIGGYFGSLYLSSR